MRDSLDQTPLMAAVQSGRLEVFIKLIFQFAPHISTHYTTMTKFHNYIVWQITWQHAISTTFSLQFHIVEN